MTTRQIQTGRTRSRLVGLVHFCWRLVKWGVIAAIVVAVAGRLLVLERVDEEIRARIQAKLAEHYRGLSVSLDSARRVEGEGIEIRGLSIVEPDAEGPGAELLHVGEIFLTCHTSLQELLHGDVGVTQAAVRRLEMRATLRPDGSWSVARLLPLPKLGDPSSPTASVTIDGASIEIFDPLKDPSSTTTLRNINLTITPQQVSPSEQSATDSSARTALEVRASLTGEHFRRIEIDGLIQPSGSRYTLRGKIERLEISPELIGALPGDLPKRLAPLGPLHGQAEVSFEMTGDTSGPAPRLEVSARVWDGRISHPLLASPLTELQAKIHVDGSGIEIEQLTARSGQATLSVSGRRSGFAQDSPLALTAAARGLRLDQKMADALPAALRTAWQTTWSKFRPEGAINADLWLTFDGQSWKQDLSVECLDVAFTYHKFPYQLVRGKGLIGLKDNVMDIHLRAFAGTQAVRVDGRLENPGPRSTGFVEVRSEGLVTIDEKLLVALDRLDRKSKRIVRSLHPSGTFTLELARFDRDPQTRELHRHFIIQLHRCSIKYEKFPYPLSEIRGTIEAFDNEWSFRDLKGRNDSGYVLCEGGCRTTPDGRQLDLQFTGTDIPLEDELREALRPGAQKIWTDLRPRGTIDHLIAVLRHRSGDRGVSLDVRLQKWPRQQNIEGRSISVTPVWLPYRMDHVVGSIHYRDGHIDLENVQAWHGTARLATAGRCEISRDGSWRVQLDTVTADRLRADRELIGALPAGLGTAVSKLNLTGPINMGGSLALAGGGSAAGGLTSNWDLTLDIENGALDCGIRLDHIHGGVRFVGDMDQAGLRSRGQLTIDSLVYKDLQFTEVQGPVWIDRSRIAFGDWAEGRQSETTPQQITAKILGGTLRGDARVSLAGDSSFELRAGVADADLARLAREMMPRIKTISGKVSTSFRLSGTMKGAHTLRGDGQVRLHEANIYELPVMVNLLKILSIRPPDKTAFTASDIEFRVQGENIYLDRVDFDGDAISLKGKGEMNLDREIKMDFYTLVGNDSRGIPALRQLLGQASRQILLIHVTGSLDDPLITQNPFPALNESVQQLFPELFPAPTQGRSERQTPLDQLREALKGGPFLPKR